MADISINLREASPELEGSPTFSAFLKQGIIDGVVGETNIGRIQAFGIADMLDVETRIYLEVAHMKGVYDGIELRQHNIGEFILPILRVASDFEASEKVSVRPTSKNATWEAREVYAIVPPSDLEQNYSEETESEEFDNRGKILIGTDTAFEYRIKPNWPGLLPINLHRLFEKRNRVQNKLIDDTRVSALASFFFRASFFDQEFELDERFVDQCYSSLRNYELAVPKRPTN
jgi:hypothetical protein